MKDGPLLTDLGIPFSVLERPDDPPVSVVERPANTLATPLATRSRNVVVLLVIGPPS